MTEPLPSDQLERLLPALRHVAELVRKKEVPVHRREVFDAIRAKSRESEENHQPATEDAQS